MGDLAAKRTIDSWPDSEFESAGWHRLRRWALASKADTQPYLFIPGSRKFSIFPDGLYGRFGQDETRSIEYVDILAFEVCSSRQNFYDKRSRYAEQNPLGLFCQPDWLEKADFIKKNPDKDLQNIPVRYRAITFVLNEAEFDDAKRHISPWGCEYFAREIDLDRLPWMIAKVASRDSRFLLAGR